MASVRSVSDHHLRQLHVASPRDYYSVEATRSLAKRHGGRAKGLLLMNVFSLLHLQQHESLCPAQQAAHLCQQLIPPFGRDYYSEYESFIIYFLWVEERENIPLFRIKPKDTSGHIGTGWDGCEWRYTFDSNLERSNMSARF